MARGIALIVAAVLLGVVLLRATDSPTFDTANTTNTTRGNGSSSNTTVSVPGTTTIPTAAAHNPAEVTVLVANGANIDGLASKIVESLKSANFVFAQPGNTRETTDASAVYFTPGFEADAAAISALLNPHPTVAPLPDPSPVEDMKSANVLVVAAADLATAAG